MDRNGEPSESKSLSFQGKPGAESSAKDGCAKRASMLMLAMLSIMLAALPHADAQMDTVRPSILFANLVMTNPIVHNKSFSRIANTTFPTVPNSTEKFLYNLLLVKGFEKYWNPRLATFTAERPLIFDNCSYYPYNGPLRIFPDSIPDTIRFVFNRGLEIDGTKAMSRLSLTNVSSPAAITVTHSTAKELYLSSADADLDLVKNDSLGSVVLVGTSKGALACEENRFTSLFSDFYTANRTFVKGVSFSHNLYKHLAIRFYKDTIRGGLLVINQIPVDSQISQGPDYGARLDVLLQDCYIDCPVDVFKSGRLGRVSFDHCSFGPNASNIFLFTDSVSLLYCFNLPSSLTLQLATNHKRCWLNLNHTSLGDASFNYGRTTHLAFETAAKSDEYTGVYETLMLKFKKDGAKESYERLDIEYHQFLAAKGSRWDRIADWAEEQWWNYGYSKLLVVKWTGIFLGVFFVLNALCWRRLQQVYPISQEYTFVDRQARPLTYHALELIRVFLYTLFIFFSIKIDLDRLKLTNPALLAYFIFQWLVGLWCLFFIVNALLKIG